MRIALVSPYSWTYHGGVRGHVEGLAGELLACGHDVQVLTPVDEGGAGRRGRKAPMDIVLPAHVHSLGPTVSPPANGNRSNIAISPFGVLRMRALLRAGDFDVVHVHEPIVPAISWDAVGFARGPLVGTFHTYSTNRLTNNLGNLAGAARRFQRLHVRIAVSRAAQWTGLRFFGGSYRLIPNGVAVPERLERPPARVPSDEHPLRLVFVGWAVERKGLRYALEAFASLRERVPATFEVIGPTALEVESIGVATAGVNVLTNLADAERTARVGAADLLLAPSTGGESFGMVLTEAFALGTPVVASSITGYNEVVDDGVQGLLVPPRDAAALAAAVLELAGDVPRRERMSAAAAEKARTRYAWSRVATQVLEAYDDAIAMPAPSTLARRLAIRIGVRSVAPGRHQPRQTRLAPLERRS